MTKQPPKSQPSDVLHAQFTVVDHNGDAKQLSWRLERPDLRLKKMPVAWGRKMGEEVAELLAKMIGREDSE